MNSEWELEFGLTIDERIERIDYASCRGLPLTTVYGCYHNGPEETKGEPLCPVCEQRHHRRNIPTCYDW